MMLYRYADGTYKASSFDAEYSRVLTREEGNAYLREDVDEVTFNRIMSENLTGFMPNKIVESC